MQPKGSWLWSQLAQVQVLCMCAKLLQSCPTLCDPIDHCHPGSSVHGIFQARILEWVAMPSSRYLSAQGSNPHLLYLLHCRQILYLLSHQGSSWLCRLFAAPLYLTYMQSTSCEMPGWIEAQAGIKIARRNINNLRYADDTMLIAESKEELKSLLMKVKDDSENTGLKLKIQKTKILASGPITSWQIHGETMETVTDFTFLGSKITADGDHSHEIKRRLLLGRKAMTILDSILKSRDITLSTKVC